MNYTFMTLHFSDQRQLVRIHFSDPMYYGLERFFNDDALLLQREIDDIHFCAEEELAYQLAGNRCVLTLTQDLARIEDQWDPGTEGYFAPLVIPSEDFFAVYLEWKEELDQ